MATTVKQPGLFESGRTTTARNPAFSGNKEEAIHRWVPWIAGFSAEFVRSTLREFLPHQNRGIGTVLDPFAGVGTTLVETVRAGHHAVGFEINPYAALAARVKLGSASLDLEELIQAISRFRRFVERRVAKGMKPSTNPPSDFRSRVPF
ncbi:MAG: DNA methyltransferase, partial [Terriglobia bacterium]